MPTLRDLSQGVFPHESTHVSGGSDPFLSTDLLEAAVKRVQTSSGPTTLTVGAIADGEFLQRSGTGIVGASSPGTTPLEVKIVRYQLVY